jgi:hypothetical protein
MSRIAMDLEPRQNWGMALLVALAIAASGLHGTVVRGPTQPVCQVGQPCSAPAAHTRLVFARSGHAAVQTLTDARGRYSVRLTAGFYTVRVAPAPSIGRGIRPLRVHVAPGVIARLDFFIDTGIR